MLCVCEHNAAAVCLLSLPPVPTGSLWHEHRLGGGWDNGMGIKGPAAGLLVCSLVRCLPLFSSKESVCFKNQREFLLINEGKSSKCWFFCTVLCGTFVQNVAGYQLVTWDKYKRFLLKSMRFPLNVFLGGGKEGSPNGAYPCDIGYGIACSWPQLFGVFPAYWLTSLSVLF